MHPSQPPPYLRGRARGAWGRESEHTRSSVRATGVSSHGGAPCRISLRRSPSPVLWGGSWLPQFFLSRAPGLAHRGALFLGRLLFARVPQRRRPGQHAASGGEGSAGKHLWAPRPRRLHRPRRPHRPRLPPRSSRPHEAPSSRGGPPSRPASASRRPTSRGLATTPAPSAFPGHVARAPAGGLAGAPWRRGWRGPRAARHGRAAAPCAAGPPPSSRRTAFIRRRTHTRTPEGQPRGPGFFFIALDTTSGALLRSQTLGHTRGRPRALLGRKLPSPRAGRGAPK